MHTTPLPKKCSIMTRTRLLQMSRDPSVVALLHHFRDCARAAWAKLRLVSVSTNGSFSFMPDRVPERAG